MHYTTNYLKIKGRVQNSTKIAPAALNFSFILVAMKKLVISHISLIKHHYAHLVGCNKKFVLQTSKVRP